MSWEAWGDDDASDYDHLLDAGWWDGDQAKAVTEAINALCAEPVYENSRKEDGISVRFLMCLTLLKYHAGITDGDDPLVIEAQQTLFRQSSEG